ncbi:MAG TPA: hypothetical protein VGY53_05075, partial [Isosphaeraceae bacterium]|nr:hypothetical protein [Isosphaeraceae bacterium]
MTNAPAWLNPAPFDVAAFFALPAAAENAAPLYLDAFFEFDPIVEKCFPPTERARAATAKARATRINALLADLARDPKSINPAEADALLAELAEGFRKLDLAQRRPRCVFAPGISIDAPLPHAQAARHVVRLLQMQADRALGQNNIDGAIGNLARVLRLSRDLRPRGHVICQLVSVATDRIGCTVMIPHCLAHPRLQASHCDQLLAMLRTHEMEALDPFIEGVKADYILQRVVIRTF